ncbi:MAG: SDR family NAD(P)-dependent oxidoreductase [Pseudooceanicola sp.]
MSRPDATIIITGASRGIGRALVETYTRAGVPVVAIARGFDAPQAETETRIEADLTRVGDFDRAAATIAASGRRVAALINNAGIQNAIDLTAGEAHRDAITEEIALNLAAPLHLTLALLPCMDRGAVIANVSSLVALHPKPSAPVYSATKAGLPSLSRARRHQFRPLGLHVAEVFPPLVATGMTKGRAAATMSPETMAAAIRDGIAARREVIAPGLSRRVLILNRLAPGLVARIMART